MYDVRGVLPVDTLSPGTRLLGVGPPMVGLGRVSAGFLARGLDDGEAAVVVSTDRPADEVATRVERATERGGSLSGLGIIDATGGDPAVGGTDYRVATSGLPDDLTGIGMRFSELVEGLADDGYDRFRFVVDSLSSLLVYSEFERVYRFAHVLSNRMAELDGVALYLLHADTDGEQAGRFGELFGGIVDLREREGADEPTVEWRLRGLGAGEGTWQPAGPLSGDTPIVPAAGGVDASEDGSPAAEADGRTGAAADDRAGPHGIDLSDLDSLRDAIDRVTASGYTLTLVNHDGDAVAELSTRFESLNTRVRTAELSTPEPRDAALLHRDGRVLAASPVEQLLTALRVEGDEAPGETLPDESPVLAALDREAYTVDNGGKLELVRISRLLERRALRIDAGELHTGFQRLSRMDDERDTGALYDRLADSGVTTHLYGTPDAVADDAATARGHSVHTYPGELADAWFAVFDGAGDPDSAAALVSIETSPGRYSGFWTFRAELVEPVLEYLRATYGEVDAVPAP